MTGLGFLRKGGQGRDPGTTGRPQTTDDAEAAERRAVCCRACGAEITSPDHAVEVDGGHEHTFVNPFGILFHIGCFQDARGCVNTGDPTTEFSWFPGFAWRYASCASCRTHLGWQFLSTDDTTFWGLILQRLAVD